MQSAAVRATKQDASDVQIAQRIAADDRSAFGLLMRRHNQLLYRTARSILRDDADAEDAVQDAYVHAYRAMRSFRGDSKLSTWLVRIVVNEALGRLRKRRRHAQVFQLHGQVDAVEDTTEESIGRASPEQPDSAALRAETRRLLETAIEQLPDAYRTVFVLRAVEEMTAEETAAVLDIPEATVRTRFFRARGLLRESLSREIDFALPDAFAFAGARCDRIITGVLVRLDGLANPDRG
jgi:RNA polymerase sigma-70 factor (ECF subfamily)